MYPAATQFIAFYESLGVQSPIKLEEVYANDVEFLDPVHHLRGLAALDQYFKALMENIDSLSFQITETFVSDDQAFLQWVMSYRHPGLAGGGQIDVSGISHIRFDDKVNYHRDYYDLGEMLYEHIPAYGWITRQLKARLIR